MEEIRLGDICIQKRGRMETRMAEVGGQDQVCITRRYPNSSNRVDEPEGESNGDVLRWYYVVQVGTTHLELETWRGTGAILVSRHGFGSPTVQILHERMTGRR